MKKILTAIAALLVCGSLYAQIDPTVEVSRQYKVNIADIDRPLVTDNAVADSLQHFDVGFDYSIFNRPYTDLYEFTPYQTDSISKVVTKRPPYVMAHIGSQFPFSADLELRSQLVTKPRFNLGADTDLGLMILGLDYLGEEDALASLRFDGGLSANAKTAWKKGELTLNVGYDNRSYGETYQNKQLMHTVNATAVDVSLTSADPTENSVFYSLNFNYDLADKDLTGSNIPDTTYLNRRMSIKGSLGSSFGAHRIYVNMLYQNATTGKEDQKLNVGILEFMPVWEYTIPRLKVRLGARFGNNYIGSDAATTIHPDVDIKGEVIKNAIWIRANVSGGNELNSLGDYLRVAPWICNGIPGHTYGATEVIGTRNIVAKVSVETIIAGRFALSPYFSYGNYSNSLQFRTDMSYDNLPMLIPEYTNYAATTFGLETSWKSRNLTVTGNLAHISAKSTDLFAEDGQALPAYMIPEWKAGASLDYNIKRRLFLSATYSFESERISWGGNIPVYSDLTVVATWVFNRHFSAYVKGGNLLGNSNFRYYEIPELPRNIGGGIRINF